MTTGKDTASFFENGTNNQFEYCFKLYPQVLKLKAEKRGKKPQELIRLDEWYQNELPRLIKARGKDAHMVYDELVQTMKWKQSRGKFFPQLSYLVKVNTPRAVMQETKKAFRKLPNLEQAITALSNLKGVGTTMASALLAAAAPDSAPFMADECLMAIPEIEGIDYTTKEYLNFVQHIQTTVARLNTEAGGEKPLWSPHRVELALWAHYVANDLSPKLLDNMPGSRTVEGGGRAGCVCRGGKISNGNAVKELERDGDTSDVDEESQSGVSLENARTAESEIDHDNDTNPVAAIADGDSNFVTNDSRTSQEPLIDENTTQTTASTTTTTSTSTDDYDGEEIVVTPIASDSESNLEPPQQPAQYVTIIPSDDAAAVLVAASIHTARNGDAVTGDVLGNGNATLHNNRTMSPLSDILDSTNDDLIETLEFSRSNFGAGIVEKRVLHLEERGVEEQQQQQPDLKKIRSD